MVNGCVLQDTATELTLRHGAAPLREVVMTLTILDPCTGNRVTIEVPAKAQPHRARRWVFRELDRATGQIPKATKQ